MPNKRCHEQKSFGPFLQKRTASFHPLTVKRLLSRPTIQRVAGRLLGQYLRFALRSTRWTIEGETHFAPFIEGGPVVVAFWHEYLPMLPILVMTAHRKNPTRRIAALTSRHRDGMLIAGVLRHFGVAAVHGSSGRRGAGEAARDRGGASGLRALLAGLQDGVAVAITPDGPRGPRRRAAPGVAMLAALSGAPVLACAARTRQAIGLRSWDRMVLPLPFGRGALVCLPAGTVPRDGAGDALAGLEALLTAASDRAEALCRGGPPGVYRGP